MQHLNIQEAVLQPSNQLFHILFMYQVGNVAAKVLQNQEQQPKQPALFPVYYLQRQKQ